MPMWYSIVVTEIIRKWSSSETYCKLSKFDKGHAIWSYQMSSVCLLFLVGWLVWWDTWTADPNQKWKDFIFISSLLFLKWFKQEKLKYQKACLNLPTLVANGKRLQWASWTKMPCYCDCCLICSIQSSCSTFSRIWLRCRLPKL